MLRTFAGVALWAALFATSANAATIAFEGVAPGSFAVTTFTEGDYTLSYTGATGSIGSGGAGLATDGTQAFYNFGSGGHLMIVRTDGHAFNAISTDAATTYVGQNQDLNIVYGGLDTSSNLNVNSIIVSGGNADTFQTYSIGFTNLLYLDFSSNGPYDFALDNIVLDGAVATPIPASLPLFATGLAGLGWLTRRRRKQAA